VRARNGYYGEAEERTGAPLSPVVAALSGILPKSDLGMQVTVAPFRVPGKRELALAAVLAIRQPPPADPTIVAEHVDVLVTAFDPTGRNLSSRRFSADLKLRPGAGSQVQYELITRVDLRPGRYQLRFAASSALEGKSGSIYHDLDVPDLSRSGVQLSGIAVATSPSVAAAPKEALATLLPIVPTARRDLFQTDSVTAFVRVYQNGVRTASPVAMLARVLDQTGGVVFVDRRTIAPSEFNSTFAADHQVTLSMAPFAPGPYVLSIEASGPDGKTARRDVRFERR
jgi:hypothetical protein